MLAGDRLQRRGAPPGAVQPRDGVLPPPGDLGAPLAQRVEVRARTEVGQLGLGEGGADHRQQPVVLVDPPVERGQPARGRQRGGRVQHVVEPGLAGPLLGGRRRAVSAAARARSSSTSAVRTASHRSASSVSRRIRAGRSRSSPADGGEPLGELGQRRPAAAVRSAVRACSSSRSAASAGGRGLPLGHQRRARRRAASRSAASAAAASTSAPASASAAASSATVRSPARARSAASSRSCSSTTARAAVERAPRHGRRRPARPARRRR